jgi:hypothetical protein
MSIPEIREDMDYLKHRLKYIEDIMFTMYFDHEERLMKLETVEDDTREFKGEL